MRAIKRFLTGLAAAAFGLAFVVTGATAAPLERIFDDKKAVEFEKFEKEEKEKVFDHKVVVVHDKKFVHPLLHKDLIFHPFFELEELDFFDVLVEDEDD